MILSFSKDRFVDMINSGHKIHTIREDKSNRWKPGMKIHFWRGNPRNTGAKVKPYEFKKGLCTSVQNIKIISTIGLFTGEPNFVIELDGKCVGERIKDLICKNDGLLNEQFKKWFVPSFPFTFSGKIIHWTDFKY